ncbi:hypothetical protein IAT38_005383 [Cryptococcus sp. DSM 104549]
MRPPAPLLSLPLLIPFTLAATSTPNTGDQTQAFQFQFTTDPTLQLPVTYTCPTPLVLPALTTTNAQSSDPKAPYTMVALVHEQLYDGAGVQYARTYSASLNVGDMSATREIAHPWGNGTQFIACMWASNAVSGGCQDLFTVVPSPDLTAEAYANTSSVCRTPQVLESWATPANETLDVAVTGAAGSVAINAWPPSCTDLQFTPKNGTAPFTLLIAPAFHPPINITSPTRSPMNYTVRLSHGQAFMAAMYDARGNSWAYGPLHAGRSDDTRCLGVKVGESWEEGGGYGVGVLAGGVGGAFVVGALGAGVIAFFWGRKRAVKSSPSTLDLYHNPSPASASHRASSLYTNKPYTFTDTPPLDFDTPATLYDPLLPGTGGYPQPKPRDSPPGAAHSPRGHQHPHAGSPGQGSTRGYSRPGMHTRDSTHSGVGEYTNPYEYEHSTGGTAQGGYRDSISMSDFRPPLGRPGSDGSMSMTMSSAHGQGQGQGGHGQEGSWGSKRSMGQAGAGGTVGGAGAPGHGRLPSAPSPRPGSYHSTSNMSIPHPHPSPGLSIIPPTPASSHPAHPPHPRRPSASGGDSSPASPTSPGHTPRPRNVYVVHSDGGAGDVHIQLPESHADARVIELPPGYRATPSPPGEQGEYAGSPPLSVKSRAGPGGPRDASPAGRMSYQLEPTRSRASVLTLDSLGGGGQGMGPEELRARAEAAMREKERPLSGTGGGGFGGPR